MRTQYRAVPHKVEAHVGVYGNELADSLAKAGVTSCGSLGRIHGPRARPLNPPDIGFNSEDWKSLGIEEQSRTLNELLKSHLPCVPKLQFSPKKPWITQGTLDLISEMHSNTDMTFQEVKQFRKRLKKSARKDKKQFIATALRDDFHGSSIDRWKQVRQLRSSFRPQSTNLISKDKKLVSKEERPQAFAEYLSDIVWKAPQRQSPISNVDTPVKEEANRQFTMEELNLVLRKLGTRKAPGPDKFLAELLKTSPYILKLFLLSHFNTCFETGAAPSSWLVSEVVMLVKDSKKDTRSLDNYRPISLIFASLLQRRLVHRFDTDTRDRQFGFRPGPNRSTTQPIHIMRRIIEIHARQSEPLHALSLDWSKAFDSVTFTALEQSLHFMGVPTQFIQAIMALYSNARFTVRDSGNSSNEFIQTRGLRQGCPLSP